jgi:predicted porin
MGLLVCTGLEMLSASAMASSINLYGTTDGALTYSSNQNGSDKLYLRSGNLAASKWGFVGEEDWGAQTKTIFKAEGNIDIFTGDNKGLFTRQLYVGISNPSYGTFTTGLQNTPYAHMVGGLGPTGVVTGAVGAHPGDLDSLDLTLRFANSMTYTSPKMAGFTLGAQYALKSNIYESTGKDAISFGGRYDQGPWSIAAGYYGLGSPKTGGAIYTISNNSPVNKGYQSADKNNTFGISTRYTFDKLMVGANYTNVQYLPGVSSLFADRAVFNTFGLISSYQYSPAFVFTGAYSYTQLNQSNGLTSAANYQQFSMKQEYSVSKRTAFYLVEGYQWVSGKNLMPNATGALEAVNAVASVGNSQNGTPSSGPTQFVVMMGMRHNF